MLSDLKTYGIIFSLRKLTTFIIQISFLIRIKKQDVQVLYNRAKKQLKTNKVTKYLLILYSVFYENSTLIKIFFYDSNETNEVQKESCIYVHIAILSIATIEFFTFYTFDLYGTFFIKQVCGSGTV